MYLLVIRPLPLVALLVLVACKPTTAELGPAEPQRPNAVTQRLAERLRAQQRTQEPADALPKSKTTKVTVHYEDDWFGSVSLLGVQPNNRAILWLAAHEPARLAIDVVDLSTGKRVDRWEATADRAPAAVSTVWFSPLTGTLEADARRFGNLLRGVGQWHLRPSMPSPTFAVSSRPGQLVFGAAPTDGSDGDWLFAMGQEGRGMQRVDSGLIASYSPVFSPRGDTFVFRGCSGSPCDYGLFLGRVDGKPKRITGITQSSPPVFSLDGNAVLSIGSRGAERCLFRTTVSPSVEKPRALSCVKGLTDVDFAQDPEGRTGVLAGVRGKAGQQTVDLKWLLLSDGTVLAEHSVERAIGLSVINGSGFIAMPMQKGAVALVDLVTGRSNLVSDKEGWFFGFEGARWLGDRLILLRKENDKKGYQIVTVDARALTDRDGPWL